jgi:group I intron endonuclease
MNNIVTGIYKITNLINEKVYIGQSINIEKRFISYKNLRNCKRQKKIYASLNFYGIENHTFEIIKECCIKELNYYERHYQEYYNVLGDLGLNLKYTKTNDKSGSLSDETRKKISEFQKGRKHSEETKEKMSQSQKGKIFSEDTRKKLSESATGRKLTEETRKKLSEKRKLRITKNETRKKISKNNANSKKVINNKTGETYNSVSEMCKILNLSYRTMRYKLSGYIKNKTDFMFYDEYIKKERL